jgi:hypothetical protein
VTLIHDLSMDGQSGFPTWEKWFAIAKLSGINAERGMEINNSAAVLRQQSKVVVWRWHAASWRMTTWPPEDCYACFQRFSLIQNYLITWYIGLSAQVSHHWRHSGTG